MLRKKDKRQITVSKGKKVIGRTRIEGWNNFKNKSEKRMLRKIGKGQAPILKAKIWNEEHW